MGIKLRPYQDKTYQEIRSTIVEGHKRILVQAETGWGKSVLIGKLANNLEGRTLVLTHRKELLEQNSEWIDDVGILTSNVRKLEPLNNNTNVIAMVETAYSRFEKYGYDALGIFDSVIIDEVHIDLFKKVYRKLEPNILIGLTATPIIYKKETKKVGGETYTRKITLRDEYQILVQGISVKELQNLGYLTKDKYILLKPPNIDNLVRSASNPDGYTPNSLTDVFGNRASIKKVFEGYNRRRGTKTIIFNPTTKVNLRVYEAFIKQGYENVRLYDSVNTNATNRQEIVEWFRNTPDAILCNVGVFTTGFNVKDIETIIYNKATISLPLWLQSCGRGSRIAPNKTEFYVIDLGLNVERHGFWSADRDWAKEFVLHNWQIKKTSDLLQVWECKSCGAYNIKGEFYNTETEQIECPSCGQPKEAKKSNPKYISGDLVEVNPDKPIYPIADKIYEYAKRNGRDANLAFRLVDKQLFDLVTGTTDTKFYFSNRPRVIGRLRELFRPVYFKIIKSDLQGTNRRFETQLQRTIKKLDNYYGKTKLD